MHFNLTVDVRTVSVSFFLRKDTGSSNVGSG